MSGFGGERVNGECREWKLYLFYAMQFSMFDFDPAKSAANKAKHGIDFVEAQCLWDDARSKRIKAPKPGLTEERWLIIGMIGNRLWTSVVTYRGATTRIISVRRARDDEARIYGQAD